MFNKYPYTDFHELNLDWVIQQVQMLLAKIDDLVNLNTIKYADPIDWSIARQYEQNTIVIDKATYNTYLSKLAVPVGIDINNNDYWLLIGNFSDAIKEVSDRVDELEQKLELEIEPDITELQEDSLHIANMVESIWNTSQLYTVGEYARHLNNLYKCKVQNTGVVPPNPTYWELVTVGDELKRIDDKFKNYSNNYGDSTELTLNTPFTCPKNGIVQFGGNGDSFTVLNINGTEIGAVYGGNQTTRAVYTSFKVNAGDIVTITNPVGTDSYIRRYYPVV